MYGHEYLSWLEEQEALEVERLKEEERKRKAFNKKFEPIDWPSLTTAELDALS